MCHVLIYRFLFFGVSVHLIFNVHLKSHLKSDWTFYISHVRKIFIWMCISIRLKPFYSWLLKKWLVFCIYKSGVHIGIVHIVRMLNAGQYVIHMQESKRGLDSISSSSSSSPYHLRSKCIHTHLHAITADKYHANTVSLSLFLSLFHICNREIVLVLCAFSFIIYIIFFSFF